MSPKPIQSFEEFWPFYVREHSLPSMRIMHFVGTTLSFVAIGAAIAMQMWWLLCLCRGRLRHGLD